MLNLRVVVVALVVYLCVPAMQGFAQEGPNEFNKMGFSQSVGIVKFFNSFTSYQFPNPFPPGQNPLSRLEFPVDQWFTGGTVVYAAPTWTVQGEAWTNLSREGDRKMQDSDWDDDDNVSQKTIFSESKCRLNKGTLIDVGCSIATPLEQALFVRPIIGYRYQYFYFTTHDGFQSSLDGSSFALPGDGIDFKQRFDHYYFGAICSTNLRLPVFSDIFPRANMELKFDYAVVRAKNEDLHLLRQGNHVTADTTKGHCWHLAAGLDFFAADYLRARVYGDFKRVLTDGSHNLSNGLFALDFSWDGSHVWSDQTSILAEGILYF